MESNTIVRIAEASSQPQLRLVQSGAYDFACMVMEACGQSGISNPNVQEAFVAKFKLIDISLDPELVRRRPFL
jgi:hypothetical protein